MDGRKESPVKLVACEGKTGIACRLFTFVRGHHAVGSTEVLGVLWFTTAVLVLEADP